MVQSEKILKLAHRKAFGSGTRRLCFVHPFDNSKCVKVPRPGRDSLSHYKRKSWHRRLTRTPSYYDQNAIDTKAYKRLGKLKNEAVFAHLPRFFGAVQTDMGKGTIFELMRNFDGSIARTFNTELSELSSLPASLPKPTAEAIHAFKAFIKRGFLYPFEQFSLNNLVNVHLSPQRQRIYIVDDIDDPSLITKNIHKINPAAHRRSLEEKLKTFDARVHNALASNPIERNLPRNCKSISPHPKLKLHQNHASKRSF